jgi:hypothetical protein
LIPRKESHVGQEEQVGEEREIEAGTRQASHSAESQPDDFLIAAFILGADGMMDSFRRCAIEARHSGVIPGEKSFNR